MARRSLTIHVGKFVLYLIEQSLCPSANSLLSHPSNDFNRVAGLWKLRPELARLLEPLSQGHDRGGLFGDDADARPFGKVDLIQWFGFPLMDDGP